MNRKGLILFAVFLLCNFGVAQVQKISHKPHRYRFQTYFNDSSHVFWTSYPNPFSPPTVRDTGKGLICGNLTFYCDLSDSVEVALVAEDDSIVYQTIVKSQTPPYFSLCYWVAGEKAQIRSMPSRYYKSGKDGRLKALLIVNGKKKSMHEIGIPVRNNRYYWIETHK